MDTEDTAVRRVRGHQQRHCWQRGFVSRRKPSGNGGVCHVAGIAEDDAPSVACKEAAARASRELSRLEQQTWTAVGPDPSELVHMLS